MLSESWGRMETMGEKGLIASVIVLSNTAPIRLSVWHVPGFSPDSVFALWYAFGPIPVPCTVQLIPEGFAGHSCFLGITHHHGNKVNLNICKLVVDSLYYIYLPFIDVSSTRPTDGSLGRRASRKGVERAVSQFCTHTLEKPYKMSNLKGETHMLLWHSGPKDTNNSWHPVIDLITTTWFTRKTQRGYRGWLMKLFINLRFEGYAAAAGTYTLSYAAIKSHIRWGYNGMQVLNHTWYQIWEEG